VPGSNLAWTQTVPARKFQEYLPTSNLRTDKLRFMWEKSKKM